MVQGGKFKVVFVRHGESEWTKQNLFCGWYDAPLSDKENHSYHLDKPGCLPHSFFQLCSGDKECSFVLLVSGLEEAVSSGKALKDAKFVFDVAFTSLLTRAHQTLEIIKKEIGQPDLPVVEHWRLNERHYGDLTGYNKEEMAQKYGLEQVQIWRRKFDALPPAMKETHKYYRSIVDNPKFKNQPDIQIPEVESLETSMVRTLPFWNDEIVPAILSGKRVLIVTHGTTLRGLVKHIDGISNEDIMKLNLPTGMPFYYVLDENLKPDVSMQFFSDREAVEKAMALVASISHKNP